ncbi:hypothetical protein ACWEP8_26150 [Streptomyces hydrogenans]
MSLLFREGEFRFARIGTSWEGARDCRHEDQTRCVLGTGPEVQIPERDDRTKTAFERAADGDWFEATERPEPQPVSGRRPLGPRGFDGV